MNRVLPLGKPGEFDSHSHSMPRVLQMGRTLVMWYLGNDGKTTRLGMATSPDGVRWAKSISNPVLDVGAKANWDSGSLLSHDVQWHDGQYHIWYAAHAGQTGKTIRIGYATAKPVAAETLWPLSLLVASLPVMDLLSKNHLRKRGLFCIRHIGRWTCERTTCHSAMCPTRVSELTIQVPTGLSEPMNSPQGI